MNHGWTRFLATIVVAYGAMTCAHADPLDATTLQGREALLHVPATLPPEGKRALVIVLHGGLGSARRIATKQAEGGLNMDAAADAHGFIVAYLNGTPVTRRLGDRFLGWNAGGGCCGQSFENNVDDVAYIGAAVDELVRRYGIDRSRIFAMGHSNGAMMAQRLVCETPKYAAIVAVSGPLNLTIDRCPAAQGKRVLAIHGADDVNVPLAGGVGSKGLSKLSFRSEADAQRTMLASGATYTLQVVPNADHALTNIDAAIAKIEGAGIAEKSVRFFGLVDARP